MHQFGKSSFKVSLLGGNAAHYLFGIIPGLFGITFSLRLTTVCPLKSPIICIASGPNEKRSRTRGFGSDWDDSECRLFWNAGLGRGRGTTIGFRVLLDASEQRTELIIPLLDHFSWHELWRKPVLRKLGTQLCPLILVRVK